ncbi:hypothetical protein DFH94DRAFT_612231, partial [Russula ochroleuca]
TASQKIRKSISSASSTSTRQRRAAVLGVAAAAIAASIYFSHIPVPRPMRTSILTGQLWLDELLQGHPKHFHEQMGMSWHIFRRLSHELQSYSGLKNSRHVT